MYGIIDQAIALTSCTNLLSFPIPHPPSCSGDVSAIVNALRGSTKLVLSDDGQMVRTHACMHAQ